MAGVQLPLGERRCLSLPWTLIACTFWALSRHTVARRGVPHRDGVLGEVLLSLQAAARSDTSCSWAFHPMVTSAVCLSTSTYSSASPGAIAMYSPSSLTLHVDMLIFCACSRCISLTSECIFTQKILPQHRTGGRRLPAAHKVLQSCLRAPPPNSSHLLSPAHCALLSW